MNDIAVCEKFHAMLLERRRLLDELERLKASSRVRIVESCEAMARADRQMMWLPQGRERTRSPERRFGKINRAEYDARRKFTQINDMPVAAATCEPR